MIKHITYLISIILISSCNQNPIDKWQNYDESDEIKTNSKLENKRLQFKRIQSISNDKNKLVNGFEKEISDFIDSEYELVKALVNEKSIPEIQKSISQKEFSYEELTLFYLSRIYLIEFDKDQFFLF